VGALARGGPGCARALRVNWQRRRRRRRWWRCVGCLCALVGATHAHVVGIAGALSCGCPAVALGCNRCDGHERDRQRSHPRRVNRACAVNVLFSGTSSRGNGAFP
jgi:hypothetical protein